MNRKNEKSLRTKAHRIIRVPLKDRGDCKGREARFRMEAERRWDDLKEQVASVCTTVIDDEQEETWRPVSKHYVHILNVIEQTRKKLDEAEAAAWDFCITIAPGTIAATFGEKDGAKEVMRWLKPNLEKFTKAKAYRRKAFPVPSVPNWKFREALFSDDPEV